jgi:hypothetical protein
VVLCLVCVASFALFRFVSDFLALSAVVTLFFPRIALFGVLEGFWGMPRLVRRVTFVVCA